MTEAHFFLILSQALIAPHLPSVAGIVLGLINLVIAAFLMFGGQ